MTGTRASSWRWRIGHPPTGEWELTVRVNEVERLRTLVNDTTAPDGWLPLTIDLSDMAGKEARLQLIHRSTANPVNLAYWTKLTLVEGR